MQSDLLVLLHYYNQQTVNVYKIIKIFVNRHLFIVLGYREAKKIKQLSLKNQDQIDTNTVCWKLEEQRYQLLSESFEYVFIKLY